MSDLSPFLSLLGGGDFSDIYLEDSHALSLRWEAGRVENVASSHDAGAGWRAFDGLNTRYGHASVADPFHLSEDGSLARLQDLKLKLGVPAGTKLSLPKPAPVLKTHVIRLSPPTVPLSSKTALLERAYRAAQINPLIRQVTINYGDKFKKVGYLNSEGEAFLEDRAYTVFSVTVTAERGGDRQTAYEAMGGLTGFEIFDGDAVERLAAMVAERAVKKLDAGNAPSGEMPVVIASSAGGTLIHEAVGHSLEADAVLEGTSPAYLGRTGQVVANAKLTVYDNPTVPNARGSFHFDDEGTPAEASRLIENGVLKDLMYDRLSARRAGRKSNGHGRRESYAHRPIPRMSNTYIAPGPDDPAAILRDFRDGFLVTKMGGGQVNPTTGDFVFDVEEGFRVEGGKRTMVRGAALLGNGPEVLKSIDMVGTDHGWGIGTCGKEGQGVPVSDAIPTIRIKKMVIGGQA